LLTLKGTRTTIAGPGLPVFANMLGLIPKVEVLYKGSAVFSMSGADAMASGMLVCGFESWGLNWVGAAAEEVSFTFLISLGRVLYDPKECFPRSTRGELILQITYESGAFTGFTTVKAQIETVELPDASPEQYLRMTTLSFTPSVAGEHDIELPIGNPISELVLYGEIFPLADDDDASLGYLQILIDNYRRFYSHTEFETAHNMAGRMRCPPGYWRGHVHWNPGAGALGDVQWPGNHLLEDYVHLPFDIFRDGRYALDTAGKSDVILRVNVDTLAHDKKIRVIPCEIVPSGKGF
ncbi:unnamed protein product, partial [marine sediment metagenome]